MLDPGAAREELAGIIRSQKDEDSLLRLLARVVQSLDAETLERLSELESRLTAIDNSSSA